MKFILKKKINKLFQTGFFHIFSSSVINKIVTFLSSVILVRILSKSEYGVYSYALNIYGFILLFSGLGIESAVMQAGCENQNNSGKRAGIYSFGVRYGTIANCIMAFILIFIGLLIPLPITGAEKPLLLLSFLPVITFWYGMQMVHLRVNLRNQDYSAITTVNVVLVTVGTITGALVGHVFGVVVSRYLAMGISVFVAYMLFGVPLFVKAEKINKYEKRDLLKIATISMVNNGLSQLLYLLDVFVIGMILADEKIVASYKAATQIPTALSFIPGCIVTYIYPYFASHNKEPGWCMRRYKQLISFVGIANFFISIILFIFAPLIITIVFGRQYLDAVPIFRILSISYFFSGTFRTITGNLLVAQRKLIYNMLVAIFSGIINIVADICFIMLWNGIGAALATFFVVIMTSVMNSVYYFYTLKKNMKKTLV